ncbi:hypothetical protein, partial [Polaromonas sp.]|uniref:hypothetical protein n=1 Tax=Polaromonas sp. TaxID=1869339 RepID=UPI002C13DF71
MKSHLETVALVDTQHQRSRSFAFAKFDESGGLAQIGVIHRHAIGNRGVARENHVAAKRKQHASRIEGAKAIEHNRLLKRNNLSMKQSVTAGLWLCRERRGSPC